MTEKKPSYDELLARLEQAERQLDEVLEGCRRRTIPPSCRFLGRKVYFAAVVLVVVPMRQRRSGSASAAKLREAFGVSWETVLRWMSFFDEVFPRTTSWKRLRGSVQASVGDDDLPAGLLEVMVEQAGDRRDITIRNGSARRKERWRSSPPRSVILIPVAWQKACDGAIIPHLCRLQA